MTEPADPRSPAWSRRTVLRVFAPLPLLGVAGCGGGDGSPSAGPSTGAHSAAGPHAAPSTTPTPSPTPSAAGGSPSAVLRAGSLAGAQPEVSAAPAVTDAVALTFHGDGPTALADALLGEAERSGARLTVLAVGRWLARYPQMAERVLHGGHELGNHTENHLNIDRLTAEQAYTEIEQCAVRLEALTGSRGRWFRQSQGRLPSAVVRAAATRAGYGTLLSYDLDPLDYRDPGAAAVIRNVLTKIRGGDVVSMHLGHPGTVAALPAILSGLQQRGLRAVTASELFPPATEAPRNPAVPGPATDSNQSASPQSS